MGSRPTRAVAFWKCPSCRQQASSYRSFTISSKLQQLHPESPHYIDIPEPPQAGIQPKKPMKGVLPVPRDIFHDRRGGLERITPEYLKAATPDAGKSTAAVASEAREWRMRMAQHRKQNLRDGLTTLKDRRLWELKKQAARGVVAKAKREALLNAPERTDERLTRPTTTTNMQIPKKGYVLPDPGREERIAAMKARVAEKEAARMDEQQTALHTLYMNARHFITTENQLDAAVNRAFDAGGDSRDWKQGDSIWFKELPETVRAKILKTARTKSGNSGTAADVRKSRMDTIVEEWTGGKLN